MKADVLIIGAGPAGIFTALEMIRRGAKDRILIVEKGQPVEKRHWCFSVYKPPVGLGE